ncbi:MAG: glucuronate isomerase [Kiritimatiellia bacterium]|nr:glucuronate isomerase [Kiritimatiellia bacterium]
MWDKPLIHDNFMLDTPQARQLYHEYAEQMPIIDYHCHLSPGEVSENKRWDNLTQIWLYGDHYKWRAMRTNGVSEEYCTGNASDREKFQKWAETMPYLLRNPLYHWTHLEMARYLGICDILLGPDTAEDIWKLGVDKLAEPSFSSHSLMEQSNVVLACTTDDPVDSLEHHAAVAADNSFNVQLLPTWRPDKGMAAENTVLFNEWIDKLATAADMDINDFTTYVEALRKRHDFFHEHGCRLSDHGIETAYAEDYTQSEIKNIFGKIRSGGLLAGDEVAKFKSAMMYVFGVMDNEKNWTQQIHYGVLRNNNSRMFEQAGADTGFDSIGDFAVARALSKSLDRLDRDGQLPRTILYNLNPADNALLVTMAGNFQDGLTAGKVQHGSAWWVLDQKDGMTSQIETLSQMGLLSRFVGMLTDSRSFLSYTRHEYFRRILCNILGDDMARGLLPGDMELVGRMVSDISYNNAARYFGFDLPVVGE